MIKNSALFVGMVLATAVSLFLAAVFDDIYYQIPEFWKGFISAIICLAVIWFVLGWVQPLFATWRSRNKK